MRQFALHSRLPSRRPLLAVVSMLFLVACGDGAPDSDGLIAPDAASPSLAEAAAIEDGIEAVIPGPGLRTAALARFNSIARDMDAGHVENAQSKTLELVPWLVVRLVNGQVLDPNGGDDPTPEAAIAEVATGLYAFVGLGAPPPIVLESGPDAVVALIGPGGGTVTTASEHAGVDVSDAAVDAAVVIKISRLDQDPCLPTPLGQFDGCYAFDKFPGGPFLEEVTVGVCLDPAAAAGPDHDRLELYRFSADEAELGVQPLENVDAPFLDCSDFTVAAAAPSFWRLPRAGFERLSEWLVPSLRAANLGPGGLTISFSTIGWARQPPIAFTSEPFGNQDILVSNPMGHGLIGLTTHPANDLNPKWSPDGAQISFGSTRDGDLEVYIMEADGTGITRITESPGHDLAHSWSADGSTLTLTSDRSGIRSIYLMNADGTGTPFLLSESAGSPDLSPDGTLVVYEGTAFRPAPVGQTLDIFTIGVDGTGAASLTNDPVLAARPAWSPDGTRVAFTSGRDGNLEIYVVDADGTNPVRLTNSPGTDVDPAWSPDGSLIAFTSDRMAGGPAIFAVSPDGTGLTLIARRPAPNQHPDWQPE